MRAYLDAVLQDLRVATRGFVRAPAFAVTAILAIAIGVGASAAVFSVVDRILFRSLPYPQEKRLVSLGFTAPIEQQEFLLGADYYEWREEHSAFESMTAWAGTVDCDLASDRPERLTCARVESSFLPTLGVQLLVGRNFTREEDLPNGPRAVLLTYGLWHTRFASDRRIVGRQIRIDGEPRTVVGILPESFEMPTLNKADLLIPQALNPANQQRPRTGAVLRAFARLKPGVTVEQAKAALAPCFARSLQFVPAPFRKEVHLAIRPLRDRQTQEARLASWMLLGAVFAVLLIACANVANLLLARSTARRRETAVRIALGASRVRLVTNALTESILLGVLGGAGGLALAWALLRVFASIAPHGILRLEQASLDGRVLIAAFVASILSGMVFGLAPSLAHRGTEALAEMRVAGSRRSWLGPAMLAAQIALSLVLLSAASLLLRSLWNLQNVPLGMRPAHVSTIALALGARDYPRPENRAAFFDDAVRRAQQIPGIEVAALADSIPPAGQTRSMIYSLVDVEGRPQVSEGSGGMVVWRSISPTFFETLGVPILRGRAFDETDRRPDANTVIVGDSLARRLFQSQNPLGQRLRFGRTGPWRLIVGVAGAVKNAGLAGPDDPEYYLPRANAEPGRLAYLIVRSRLPANTLAAQVRAQIGAIDQALPISVEPMAQRVSQLTERPRFNALLLTAFALAAVMLAAIGLYGLMSFLVAQRTREIGVRMALGATRAEVAAMVLSQAGRWTLAGGLIGIAAAIPLPRVLKALLYDAPPQNIGALAAAMLTLLVVALAAAWVPSRRAASVDPMQALRHD